MDDEPVSLHIGQLEFEVEDETGYVTVPKEFLTGFRLSELRDRLVEFARQDSLDSGGNSRVYALCVTEVVHIGKAAKLGGVSVDTIRFYQKLGLVKSASRSTGGYRLFDGEQIRDLKFVRHAQKLGFSLTEVKELLALRTKHHACSEVQSMLKRKLGNVREKIKSLARLERELGGALRNCNRELRLKREIKHEDCCSLLTKLDRMNDSNSNKYVSIRRKSADK